MAAEDAKFIWHPANPDHRSPGLNPKLIVIHSTEGYPAGDLSILTDGGPYSASVHFLIMPDGKIYQMAYLSEKCNHTGTGFYKTYFFLKSVSIGIEMSNPSVPGKSVPYPEVQLKALDYVINWIDNKLGFKCEIIGHKDITRLPGYWHKTDPDGDFPLDNYKNYRNYAGKTEFFVRVGTFNIDYLKSVLAYAKKGQKKYNKPYWSSDKTVYRRRVWKDKNGVTHIVYFAFIGPFESHLEAAESVVGAKRGWSESNGEVNVLTSKVKIVDKVPAK